MANWVDKVFIYEVNTRVWLNTLSRKYNHRITLDNVPDEAIDDLARPNVDMIWLMGVWQRSVFARQNALKYQHEYMGALPDLTPDDVIGSAYSIGAYVVDEGIGGREGLAHLRERFLDRGLQLILDYVPNHVGVDHPWINDHPDYFVQGTPANAKARPSDFFIHQQKGGKPTVFAHGRDPLFPGWEDTAQLNAFNPALRGAVTETLLDIAAQCDGARCDMAMLVMNDIFAGTWQGYLGGYERPEKDYWNEIIPQVREQHPEFMFIAEVYWDQEWAVMQQGFDFAYDKTLYDRIMENDVGKLRQHLLADIQYQQKMIRFIENHDEPRAYDRLGADRSFPAATLICTLPGATLLHQGQFSGRRIKLPVQIQRQPDEPFIEDLYNHYLKLLHETRDQLYENGQWYLFETHPFGGDRTHGNLLAYGWRERGKHYRLVVVNLTGVHSKAVTRLSFWRELGPSNWRLHDTINGTTYERTGKQMVNDGLYIELAPYESHIFRFERIFQPIAEQPVYSPKPKHVTQTLQLGRRRKSSGD
jgi:hypothetical protein